MVVRGRERQVRGVGSVVGLLISVAGHLGARYRGYTVLGTIQIEL